MSESVSKHRYLLALPRGKKEILLSWRLLESDAADAPFQVERRPSKEAPWVRVSDAPVADSTTFLDHAPEPRRYEYRVVAPSGVSETVSADAAAGPTAVAISAALNPDDHLRGMSVALGDLCNDGRIGYVLRVGRAETVWMLAYGHDGSPLWEKDTGLPASGGWDGSMLHVPVACWDLNGDGRTEVAFHTSKRRPIEESYDTAGSDEFLTAVDAETGEVLWEAPWPAVHSRVMMTVGHLRGMDRPASMVVQDETYGPVTLTALDGADGRVLWRVRHTAAIPGLQPHTAEDARHEYGAADAGAREEGHFPIFLPDGSHWLNLTEWQRKNFVPVHWDEGPEVTFVIRKEHKRIVRLRETGEIEDVPGGDLPESGHYGSNMACADVIGDYRENIVTVDMSERRLVVLANPTVARRRGASPYGDFHYRHDRSQHGSGYYRYLSPPYTAR